MLRQILIDAVRLFAKGMRVIIVFLSIFAIYTLMYVAGKRIGKWVYNKYRELRGKK